MIHTRCSKYRKLTHFLIIDGAASQLSIFCPPKATWFLLERRKKMPHQFSRRRSDHQSLEVNTWYPSDNNAWMNWQPRIFLTSLTFQAQKCNLSEQLDTYVWNKFWITCYYPIKFFQELNFLKPFEALDSTPYTHEVALALNFHLKSDHEHCYNYFTT